MSRAANAFGLDRRARAQGVEAALVLRGLPGAAWIECRTAPDSCLETLEPAARIRNGSPRASLCGTLGFVEQKPVPWVWVRPGETIVMPSRVARAEVAC